MEIEFMSRRLFYEILLAGSYRRWVEKWKLDDSRAGCMLFAGPHVEDIGDG